MLKKVLVVVAVVVMSMVMFTGCGQQKTAFTDVYNSYGGSVEAYGKVGYIDNLYNFTLEVNGTEDEEYYYYDSVTLTQTCEDGEQIVSAYDNFTVTEGSEGEAILSLEGEECFGNNTVIHLYSDGSAFLEGDWMKILFS